MRRYCRPRREQSSTGFNRGIARFEPLEKRRLLSASGSEIGAALDLDPLVAVTYTGHEDAVGVYENYFTDGLLGMPTGPDGDFLVLSTANAHDAVRTTDGDSRDATVRHRDLGAEGVADDFATVTFTIDVPTGATFNQRFIVDFLYASDADTDGGDFFDIIVNGINIADTHGGRIEAGGQYVTNERDAEIEDDVPGWSFEIGTEFSDILSATYTIPDGTTSLDITLTIADSMDPEKDAWVLIDNIRFEETQVVFLDFDGENIGDFFLAGTEYIVPDFDANDFGLGSDFADTILADLEALFAPYDIEFTSSTPGAIDFMHVVVGGSNLDTVTIEDTNETEWLIRELDEDDPSFETLFNFINFRDPDGDEASYGLADQLDLGNEVHNDMAVIFADQLSRDGYEYEDLINTLAHYIGRNLGLRAESGIDTTDSVMIEDIVARGSLFEDQGNTIFESEDGGWADLDLLGQNQNAHEVLLDNLGAAGGETAIRNSWLDARKFNQAHWTIVPPTNGDLFDANFTIIGDAHTRTVTTTAPVWAFETILVTDYAGQDPSIMITASSRAGRSVNYETIEPRNLGQFTAVSDDASFALIGLFEVVGNGAFFQGSATLIQTQAIDTTVYYDKFTYTEDDGDQVTVTLRTGTGLFTVSEGDFGKVITLAETDANRDTLKFNVNKKGGDGRAEIGGILGTGLKQISASKIDFNGTGIDIDVLDNGSFGHFVNGTDFNVRQNERDDGKFDFELIDGDSRMVFGRETKSFSADNVDGARLVFDDLKKLDSKADLNLGRLDVQTGNGAKITAKNDVLGGFWNFWGEDKNESLSKFTVKGRVGDGFSLVAEMRVTKTIITGDFDGDFDALEVNKFQTNGDWSGSMILRKDGDTGGSAAAQVRAKGAARDLLFQAGDSVSKIQLAAAIDSRFYIGFDFSVDTGLPVDAALLDNVDAKVKSLKLTGSKVDPFDMENSIFSAAEFQTIKLGDVNGDNNGTPFGVSAMEIKSIEFDTGTGKVKNKNDDAFNDNDTGDDFFIGRIL